MNEKQKRFADYYIETGNITESAIKAGYSENYANAQGYKLLDNVGIKKYIDEQLKTLKSERIADQEEILKYLTSVMRGDMKEETLRGVGKGDQVISDIDVSAKDRIKAAELLGKRYVMWTDKQQHEGNVGVTIVDDLDED